MSDACRCERNLLSPTAGLLALGYYDGPISGVAACSRCQAKFAFDMLYWTNDHRFRMYMIFKIRDDEYSTIVDEIGEDISSDEIKYKIVKSMLHPRSVPDELIVWDNLLDRFHAILLISDLTSNNLWQSWDSRSEEIDSLLILDLILPGEIGNRK